MPDGHDIVFRLTEPSLPASQRRPALRAFAAAHGWLPSDELEEYPGLEAIANGHLVVEHGLANTAVITFLKADSSFSRLRGRLTTVVFVVAA